MPCHAKTIRNVIAELEAMGLSVYGPNCDLRDGQLLPGNMDYTADDVLKYRRLHNADAFWYYED